MKENVILYLMSNASNKLEKEERGRNEKKKRSDNKTVTAYIEEKNWWMICNSNNSTHRYGSLRV